MVRALDRIGHVVLYTSAGRCGFLRRQAPKTLSNVRERMHSAGKEENSEINAGDHDKKRNGVERIGVLELCGEGLLRLQRCIDR